MSLSRIDDFKNLLKKSKENINNEKGVSFLLQALDKMDLIREEPANEKEIDFCRNAISAYQKEMIEKAKLFDQTTNFEELKNMENILWTFKMFGFDIEVDFSDTYSKIFFLYLNASYFKKFGKYLTDKQKKEIFNCSKKKSQP